MRAVWVPLLFFLISPSLLQADSTRSGLEFFESKIRPALAEHCLNCHSGELAQAGLRLDFRGGWQKGGMLGPAVVPGDPDKSLLIRALRHEPPGVPMPLSGEKLSAEIVSSFEQWVRMGAPDPRDTPAAAKKPAEKPWADVFSDRRRWWSLQPVVRPRIPAVKRMAWSSQAVDRFILARLEKNGLSPAPKADRATLLRRLSFVLTGLPPTPGEVAAFVNDPSPKAYARAVDRFLASPHFGEHWARHWMDVVRYTDTYGYEWDIAAKGAWRYRDYLIRAFNQDVSFDQLVREQIAGDLLPQPRINGEEQINESIIGPMSFQFGEKRHGDSLDVNGVHQEMLNNKIDAFSKAFQGMTVACARCHEHKLDAISQRDYYALAGVLMSSRWVSRTLDTGTRNATVLGQLRSLKTNLRTEIGRLWLDEAQRFTSYLQAAQAALDQSSEAAQLAQSLDPGRLAAWKRAVTIDAGKKLAVEEVLYPWQTFRSGASWNNVAEEYERLSRERTAANARDFTTVADFSRGVPPGWSVEGVGFRDGPVAVGDFTVALSGSNAVSLVLAGGLYTNTLSPKLNGAVRSPYLDHTGRGRISFQAAGGDFAAHRLVVSNAFLTERQTYMKDSQPRWTTMSPTPAAIIAKGGFGQELTDKEDAEFRTWVELATKTSNPNFPPRVGLGGECTEEQARDPRSWFGITRAVAHDGEASPADELARFVRLFAGDSTASLSERYGRWFAGVVAAWADGRAGQDEIQVINWLLERDLLPNRMDARPALAELVAAYRDAEEQLAAPQTVMGMADFDPGYDVALNVRGSYDDLGDAVPRGHVMVLSDSHQGFKVAGSGRLELAELVASPKNPLTARVFVNRVWHWVFGTGIVSTTDDFGHIGDRPSHPELLDHLADRFVRTGWSVKQLVRSLALSETFQQSGLSSARGREVDPLNRLLHHFPLRRLEAESVRDAILAVSTRLDCRMYGQPINPPRSKEDPQKRLFSGPLDGEGRRSIYTKMTIMEQAKLLATFNQPAPKIPTGRRDVTNVPAQALALLNDPFVLSQAEYWARQLIGASHFSARHTSPRQRLAVMFRSAFSRDPNPQELLRWSKAVSDFASLHQNATGYAPHTGMMNSVAVWRDVAHAIFNTKEFLYVR